MFIEETCTTARIVLAGCGLPYLVQMMAWYQLHR
jgi:hypothetical protein